MEYRLREIEMRDEMEDVSPFSPFFHIAQVFPD